jgi:outer membrane protein W
MRKVIFAGLLTAVCACAQGVSVGVLGGAPFLNVVSATTVDGVAYSPTSLKYTVGGAFQLNLPFRLRIELDALYRPASFSVSTPPSETTASEWRFPVILQYRLNHGGFFQPFLGVGASFQHLYQIGNAIKSGTGSIVTNSPAGMLVDGGVDYKLGLFRLSTELRYTRQFNDSIQSLSQLNQAEVLVGFHF